MYHVIVNEKACTGGKNNVWLECQRVLEQEAIHYQVHVPKSGPETEQLVRELTSKDDENHLIVLGGDGTFNTVLQGIVSFEKTKLSCIRTGSGNDFARNMHISKDTQKVLLHILHTPEEKVLDYGELLVKKHAKDSGMRKRFLISSGIGYDADICEEVSRSRLKPRLNKIHLGQLVYTAIGIKQIFSRRSGRAKIKLDDTEKIKVNNLFFVVGMVHPCEGGGVPFCPSADPTDGCLDICLVQDMPRWKLLLAVALVYAKKHYLFPEITGYRCKKIAIQTENAEWFHMDGETPYRIHRMTLTCRSGLRLVI